MHIVTDTCTLTAKPMGKKIGMKLRLTKLTKMHPNHFRHEQNKFEFVANV